LNNFKIGRILEGRKMIIVTVIFNLNIKKLILRDFWLEFGKLQGFSKEET